MLVRIIRTPDTERLVRWTQGMVRRDVMNGLASDAGAGKFIARCAFPVGASPTPVSIGAPGSRPQA